MTNQSNISYILFRYAGSPDQTCVAAVMLYPEETGPVLRVHTRPHWDSEAEDGELLQLARETLNEWRRTNTQEASEVFRYLQEASMGPFIAVKSDTCPANQVTAILSEELAISR